MFVTSRNGRSVWRSLSAVALIIGTVSIAAAAQAGECPADKIGVDVTKPSTLPAKDVTDKVLASIDLSRERVALKDNLFRLRQLVIKPGGVVPWHSHGDRPAIIYIVKGEIIEYASNCAVPIVHKAGEVARETSTTAHWWKNTGKETVVLLSADLLHTGEDEHTM